MNNLDNYAEKGDDIFMKKIDETGYFNHKNVVEYDRVYRITFPNIILNKMDYKRAIRLSSLEIK